MLRINLYDNNETQDEVFRVMAKEMTFVQSFMTMNCTKSNLVNDNPQAADFWITTTYQPKRVHQYPFLYLSGKLINEYYFNNPICSPTQSFLVDFLEHNNDEFFSSMIFHANIAINNNYDRDRILIPLDEVEIRVKKFYDIDTVFWYQNMVITTAVKIIVMEMLKGLEEEGPSYLQQFKSLVSTIYNETINSTDFPDSLVAGINVLNENIVNEDANA